VAKVFFKGGQEGAVRGSLNGYVTWLPLLAVLAVSILSRGSAWKMWTINRICLVDNKYLCLQKEYSGKGKVFSISS
jgi:hypothetical protein